MRISCHSRSNKQYLTLVEKAKDPLEDPLNIGGDHNKAIEA
jgi:hypothetical protein